jgi:peptide/nickel transport system permease protein
MESTEVSSDLLASMGELREEQKIYVASQGRLMWLHFKRHKVAIVGLGVVCLMYLVAFLHGFVAPYERMTRFGLHVYMPPTPLRFYDGKKFSLQPFVYGVTQGLDPTRKFRVFEEDKSVKYPIFLFVPGDKYKFLGLFETDLHLFGVHKDGIVSLLGTDSLGRDVFSRILYGSAISLSIGLLGVLMSFLLGAVLGGISGYYGGLVDTIIQRVIEFLMSVPTIPLWMALAAAVPVDWPPVRIYFMITVILSLVGWCGLARIVRSKILELREEDFTMAARLAGCNGWQVIRRHLLPSTMSYLIVHMTMAIPGMMLGETALSFLGLGLRTPVVSWGVMLNDTMNVAAVLSRPWLMWPAAFVVCFVLACNFMGDGLRDAADPYRV